MTIIRTADTITWQEVGARRSFSRNPVLQPFTSTSVWNLPIADTATFEIATDAKTAKLINPAVTVWANQPQYSHPIYQAQYGDSAVAITDSTSLRSGAYRCPASASPAAGTDAHMHVIDPHQRFVDECYGVTLTSQTEHTVGRHCIVDLYGDGLGPLNGVRAYGGSAIAGLIRAWEVDSTHSAYTGSINHAIALAIDVGQLLYTSGSSGYDANGYGTALGYVWPATEQDWNSPGSYSGTVPMGTYFAIPSGVNINAIGLATNSGKMLARALQDYGGYIVDATNGTVAFYIEVSAPTAFRDELLANNTADLKAIRSQLRVVTNNSSATPNGGTLAANRRQPLLSALPALPEYEI